MPRRIFSIMVAAVVAVGGMTFTMSNAYARTPTDKASIGVDHSTCGLKGTFRWGGFTSVSVVYLNLYRDGVGWVASAQQNAPAPLSASGSFKVTWPKTTYGLATGGVYHAFGHIEGVAGGTSISQGDDSPTVTLSC